MSDDIISLIHRYFGSKYTVYKTTHGYHGWKPMSALKDKEIIHICAGYEHCLFLESNGDLYSLGSNEHGELGLGKDVCKKCTAVPTIVSYFKTHNIKIKAIASGLWHNLAIDRKGNVYSWGLNFHGQCEKGSRSNDYSYESDVTIPQKVSAFKLSNVKRIGCGGRHSYVCTSHNKHYVWGNNDIHQCVGYKNTPYLLNQLFSHSTIANVYLGIGCTLIIVK